MRSTTRIFAGVVALGLAAAGCSKTVTCRPDTLFVHLVLGPYATANFLDVDVRVGTSGTPRHTELPLTSGVSSGGVEIQFPSGYTAGQVANVTLVLRSGTTELARSGPHPVTLAAGCTTFEVDFGAGDGGQDATAGASGSGGRGGTGGGVAGTGVGGSAGTAGTTAGAGGGGGGAGTTGAGGIAGSGGVAGRGGTGGTAGVAGTGGVAGAAGRGGTGGIAGAAGRGGTGGIAGAGGRGGTGPVCVPTTEQCFNNIDDDCDNLVDCADPQCTPVAQCVMLDPALSRIGVLAGAGVMCPNGFGAPMPIMSGFNGGTCTGCSCAPAAVTCMTQLSSFTAPNECSAAGAGTTAGSWRTGQEGPTCYPIPPWTTNAGGQVFGIATTTFAASVAGCTPGGMAAPTPPSWTAMGQFCSASTMQTGGCGMGRACVPVAQGSYCQLLEGQATCPAGTTGSAWFTGYTGTQMCGACACGSPTGASCANVRLSIGSDYTCTGVGTLTSGGRMCFGTNGIYQPGVAFTGTATPPTCAPSAPSSGNLAPSGRKTLCCY